MSWSDPCMECDEPRANCICDKTILKKDTNSNKTINGIELIAKERQRQIEAEGYTSQHDDKHTNKQLIRAAVMYAQPGRTLYTDGSNIPVGWPWDPKHWKPTPDDRIRELTKAGALIAAEIDRLQRKEDK